MRIRAPNRLALTPGPTDPANLTGPDLQGALEKLIVVIKKDDLSEEPLERFVLDFTWLVDHSHLVGRGNWR